MYKILFHLKKISRLIRYSLRYRINKWRVIDGISIPVYLKYGYSVLRFIDDGTYEAEELNIVKNRISQKDIIIELGTGLGFITSFCAKYVGGERTYSYEANALMEPIIKETFQKNQVSPVFQIAFAGFGDGNFAVQRNFLASSQQLPSTVNVAAPVLNLNKEIQRIKPTYLIMDIEGTEYDIFKGINFHSINKVQFELHPNLLSENQIDEIYQVLQKHKFKLDPTISTNKNLFFERATSS